MTAPPRVTSVPDVPGNEPLRLERRWTGSDVTYVLTTPAGEVPLTSADFRSFTSRARGYETDEYQFVATSQREHCSPEQFGLVRRSETQRRPGAPAAPGSDAGDWAYQRPEAASTDPYLVWKNPQRGVGGQAINRGGRWHLRLPLLVKGDAPPVGHADWNDETAIADLARMAHNPDAAWTLYTLGHAEVVAEHQAEVAKRDAQEQAKAEGLRLMRAHETAWLKALALTEVKAAPMLQTLRARHIGDTAPVVVQFESLPMRPEVLLADPVTAARIEFTETIISPRHCVGSKDPADAGYPVAGWRMLLLRAASDEDRRYRAQNRYLFPAEQRLLGPAWAARLREALTPKSLSVIERPDGFWVVRDEEMFNRLHEAWISREGTAPFGAAYHDYVHNCRRIDVPKR